MSYQMVNFLSMFNNEHVEINDDMRAEGLTEASETGSEQLLKEMKKVKDGKKDQPDLPYFSLFFFPSLCFALQDGLQRP